jgi:hypothetical protein
MVAVAIKRLMIISVTIAKKLGIRLGRAIKVLSWSCSLA